jgi:drug/metabolite transporter (DMT)-like permease
MSIDKKKIMATMLLLFITVIWGSGFAVSQMALDANISAGLIVAIRFSIAAIIMFVLFYKNILKSTKVEWKNGLFAGTVLFLSFLTQTIGLKYTTPSNNAMITSLNVLFVPFFAWIIMKHKPDKKIFLLLFLSLVGVFFLTYSFENGITFNIGDLLTLVCAIFYAVHVAFLGVATKGCSAKNLTFIQMFVVSILSIIYVLCFDFNSILEANYSIGLIPVIYLGIFSTCLAFFIQTYAQKFLHPSRTALILTCEGVFGTLFSVLLGFEFITAGMIVGGSLVFTSVLLSVNE